MKIATSFLAALLFTGTLGTLNNAIAADGDNEKVPLAADSYCHEKFPAIRGRTLGTDNPTLKSEDSGDVIDFYGPCDENPTGKDQQWEQQLEQQHRYQSDYEINCWQPCARGGRKPSSDLVTPGEMETRRRAFHAIITLSKRISV